MQKPFSALSLLLFGCASSSSSPSAPLTVPDGAAQSDAGAGASDAAFDASDGPFRCTEHTSEVCKPKTIAPYGHGFSVAVFGGEVYWFRKTPTALELVRTSLDTDASLVVPPPTEGIMQQALESPGQLFAGDARVFVLSGDCCAGMENGIIALDPQTNALQFVDIAVPEPLGGHAIAGGQIYVSLNDTMLESWSTTTLKHTNDVPLTESVLALGSDGATLFGLMRSTSEPFTYGVIAFDGTPRGHLLTSVSSEPTSVEIELAVDATSVYYPSNTVIARVAKEGGASTTIFDFAPSRPVALLADDDAVYVADESHVYAISKTDSIKTTLADVTNTIAMAQDRDWLMWLSEDGLVKVHK